jgi:hypothetical protein
MLKRIKNLFTKENKKPSVVSAITIYTDETDEVFVDLKIKDESEISIEHFATLLSMFNSVAFIEVNNIVKYQCKNDNKEEMYGKIVERFVEKVGAGFFTNDANKKLDSPCIKPDEMI